ncbi:MAG: Putative PAS/PAC sensor protein [Methanoculleus marisnigri]|uniref:Putative PAS/PAC sensor protein n=1 Tax=Methanoculleus marisnigri TaxID=2198 RepID=A0A101J205_9EURY|nr:MAG: Putative PAS/PAC sensor protein [Methanoculleus marisnigri]KUL05531.1 MAG: Putative PAS/PAC sensor protein [Methanoculleus marisnigri]
MHYSGAAGMNCNTAGKQKSERERVAEMLLCPGSCSAQGESRVTAASARDLLALLVDCQEDGIVLIGPDQTVAGINKAMEGLFGVSGYETIGMSAVEFISLCISPNLLDGEDLKDDFIVSCFFCENIPARRYCISRTPTKRVWVEYSSTVIPDGPNQGARLDTYHASPDSGRLETSLWEYQQQYAFLAAISSDPVISLDPGLTILSVSPSAGRLLGHNPDDLTGKHLSSIMAPDSIAEFQKACFRDRVSRGTAGRSDPVEGARTMEVNLIDARNQPIAAIFGFSHVGDGEGSLTGLIAVAHPKTDDDLWRETCSQLDQNIEHLACLGDRIRNPLAVIVGLADLQDNEVTQKIAEQARIIDGIITELDQGYVASLNVRQFLKKHYRLGDDAGFGVLPPPRAGFSPSRPGSADGTSRRSGSPTDT